MNLLSIMSLARSPFFIIYILIYFLVIVAVTVSNYKKPSLLYLFKPLPVLSLLFLLLITGALDSVSSKLIFAGLCAGLAGDVFMIRQEKFFLQGLISFFIGHILYTIAFLQRGLNFIPVVLFSLIVYFLIVSWILLPSVWKERRDFFFAVVCYLCVIFVMSLGASSFDSYIGKSSFFIGAVFFTVSDFFLSYDYFIKKMRYIFVAVYLFYFLAQLLIGLNAICI